MSRSRWSSLARRLRCAAIFLLSSLPAAATTFIPMTERDLAERSDVVLIGRVTRIEAAADTRRGGVVTYVTLQPHSYLRGAIGDGEVVLSERGGNVRGRGEWVFGNPEYKVGEEVLVFLSAGADGALHTTALALGKYEIGADPHGRRVARRRLTHGAASLDPVSGKLTDHLPERSRDLDAVVEAIGRAPAVARRRSSPRAKPPELSASLELLPRSEFTFLGSPPARWFEPDTGQLIGYLIDRNGDADLGFIGSHESLLQAFTAWTEVASARLALHEAGLDDPAPFGGCPDESRLVFNDPYEEIGDPLGCMGTLAVGGFCTNDERRMLNGTTFRRIVSGKVTFNNGWGDCSIWTVCNLAEVATHEIGHTLGFGHSPVDDSVMRDSAHFDGRCAHLADDDIAAASFAYPLTPPPSPRVTASASPTPSPSAARSKTPTRTPSPTRSLTRTRIPTRTRTPSRTRTGTRTSTSTRVPTRTRTPSSTIGPTVTSTPVAVTWPSSGGWLHALLDALQRLPAADR